MLAHCPAANGERGSSCHYFLTGHLKMLLDDALVGKEESRGPGGEPRRELRQLLWQWALVAEQSCILGYAVGVVPIVFATDPNLFVDWVRCMALAGSTAVSSGAILGLWTVHAHLPRLRSLWGLLGAWEPCAAGAASPREWNARRVYAAGATVVYGRKEYMAVGPMDSNLARPGSVSAAVLRFWMGRSVAWPYDVAVGLQAGVVLCHIIVSWKRPHYIADLCVALLNYPVIVIFLLLRRQAINSNV
jgi:hypothetical protein